MFRSLEIGRPFGIRVAVHWSFWLLPGVVFLSSYLGGNTDRGLFDVAAILGVFGCIVLHELGHALAARGFGIRTRDIELYPIGGVARLDRIPRNPFKELAIALAGPAVNVAIVAFLAPLMWLDGYSLGVNGSAGSWMEVFWHRILWANVGLVAFNLLPAFPMDGGRVLRAFLAMFTPRVTATHVAAVVGTGFAILFGLYGLLTTNIFLMVLAWFVYMAGQAELQAVREMEDDSPRRAPRWVGPFQPRDGDLANGWVYEPVRRAWVEYRLGVPVRVVYG
jgi:Zn-dependent protease